MARIGTLETSIVTGNCPECRTDTLLVSFDPGMFRCVNCGHDLEQKVNGVIKYVIADKETGFKIRHLDETKDG
jgi:uncharacterized protein (DUF983 family)|tara:strand:+ start:2282 stop:2500 length:219 start_codon:yes stop_codon:yes gene_type:complete